MIRPKSARPGSHRSSAGLWVGLEPLEARMMLSGFSLAATLAALEQISSSGAALSSESVSVASGPEVVLGPSDNISLDQPRVTFGMEDPANPGVNVGPPFYNEAILDTGANGVLLGNPSYYDFETDSINPDMYAVARDAGGNPITYTETGVAGTSELDVLVPYDINFAGTDPADVKVLPGKRAFGDPTLDLGGFAAIMGMPAMIDRVTQVDLLPMLDENVLQIGVQFLATPPTPSSNSVHIDFTMLAPEHPGQHNPNDPVPYFAPLPLIEGVTTGFGGLTHTVTALLDTGAQTSIISTDTALALGIDPVADAIDYIEIGGVGGTIEVPVVAIDKLTIPTREGFSLTLTDLQVPVIDIPGIGGIVGMDVLTSGYLEHFIELLLGEPVTGYGYFSDVTLDFRNSSTSGVGEMVLNVNPEIDLTPPAGPTIGSMSVDLALVNVGGQLKLTANNVSANGGDAVTKVQFYRDTNNNGVLDTSTDKLLGTDTSSSGGWSYNWTSASPGTQPGQVTRYFARAGTAAGAWSPPVTTTNIVNAKPVVGTLTAAPAIVQPGSTFTLSAGSVTDSDGSAQHVFFYRNTNSGTTWDAGDLLLGEGTLVAGKWVLSNVSTSGLAKGSYTFFARPQDDRDQFGAAKSVVVKVDAAPTVGSMSISPAVVTKGQTLTLQWDPLESTCRHASLSIL